MKYSKLTVDGTSERTDFFESVRDHISDSGSDTNKSYTAMVNPSRDTYNLL